MPAAPDQRLLYEDGKLTLTTRRNVTFAVWRDAPGVAQLRAFERAGEEGELAYPGHSAVVNLMLRGRPAFSEEVRREVARLLRENRIFLGATAHVLLMKGLAAAAVRAFLSASLLLVSPDRPIRIFGSIEDTAPWLAETLGRAGPVVWSASDLRDAMEACCREHG